MPKRSEEVEKEMKGILEGLSEDDNSKKNNSGANTSGNNNTTTNTTTNTNNSVKDSTKIKLGNKKKKNHSQYRENLYLNKELQETLNSLSEKTGYSKSEITRKALKFFFSKLDNDS